MNHDNAIADAFHTVTDDGAYFATTAELLDAVADILYGEPARDAFDAWLADNRAEAEAYAAGWL